MSGDLRRRTVRGAAITAAFVVGIDAIVAAQGLVVTRLLGPETIGLYGLVAVTVTTILTLKRVGIDEAFVQHPVISSAGLQYIPYDRTYKGLPVKGGDFVVVTDSAGQVRYTSVAQQRSIGSLSVSLGVGAALGPAVAGVIVDHAGPSAIFWVGMIGAVPGLAAARLVPERPAGSRAPVDWLGAAVLAQRVVARLHPHA